MVKLLPLTPCDGLLPLDIGGVTVTEEVVDHVVSVAPFAGKRDAVSAALKDQIGVPLPAINATARNGDAVAQWFGHGVWLVRAHVNLDDLAAVTKQSDAWALVLIEGQNAETVLARLVPIDLRVPTFQIGDTARTMLAHMSIAITRTGTQAFEIMAMRSMAGTLVHELQAAMQGVAAR